MAAIAVAPCGGALDEERAVGDRGRARRRRRAVRWGRRRGAARPGRDGRRRVAGAGLVPPRRLRHRRRVGVRGRREQERRGQRRERGDEPGATPRHLALPPEAAHAARGFVGLGFVVGVVPGPVDRREVAAEVRRHDPRVGGDLRRACPRRSDGRARGRSCDRRSR